MTARARRRGGRGVLVILALLLSASGALRLGSGFGAAMARAPDAAEAGGPQICPEPPVALAEALSLREGRVATQEAAIADRLAALALADETIRTRLAALAEAEAALTETLALADGAAEGDLARLTKMYETMRPKDAAALFATMAPDFAAGFIGRMRPAAAAAVLSGMEAEQAYAISVLLAARNARVPTE
jgi:flagellar motility protein MotE (MotC chaperone)